MLWVPTVITYSGLFSFLGLYHGLLLVATTIASRSTTNHVVISGRLQMSWQGANLYHLTQLLPYLCYLYKLKFVSFLVYDWITSIKPCMFESMVFWVYCIVIPLFVVHPAWENRLETFLNCNIGFIYCPYNA